MVSGLVAFVLLLQNPPADRTPSKTGDVRKAFTLESKVLGNSRDVLVYLPPGYHQETRRRYPVLYLHDGQNVFDGATSFIPNQEWRADEAAESLIRAGLVEPLIIVAVPNAGAARIDEYTPTRDTVRNAGGRGSDYARMLIEELKPRIDREYRTKIDARNTGLAGSSLGGLITLWLGLDHPNIFGKLGVFSPSLWWDQQASLKKVEALKSKLPLTVWMDMGTLESPQAAGQAQAVAKVLREKGWRDGRDFVYVEEGYAGHNEAAWARRFPSMLMFLFPARR